MKISCFNINKFCGAYSLKGYYYNPKNLDFKTSIKNLVDQYVTEDNDIFFMEEFIDNQYINVTNLFKDYEIHYHGNKLEKSHVVAITLKNSRWKKIETNEKNYTNKFLGMESDNLKIICFHNTDKENENNISAKIKEYFNNEEYDIILGDFNGSPSYNSNKYRDLISTDMITYKPAQSTLDHIYIKICDQFKNKISFNGIIETYASDHNLLTFILNI